MPRTCKQLTAGLRHMLTLFYNEPADNALIFNSFQNEGYTHIIDLTTLPFSDIDSLHFNKDVTDDSDPKNPVKTTASTPLDTCFKSQLNIIKGYIVWCLESQQPIVGDNYSTITLEDMNTYWMSNISTTYLAHGALSTDKPKILSTMVSEDPLLSAFERGIKRDPTQFNTFQRDSD